MTMTKNSIRDAYRQLVEDGLLNGAQRVILDCMILYTGPVTSGEVIADLAGPNGRRAGAIQNINAWRARFTELAGRGLIRECGPRKCRISGKVCVTWAPTGRTEPLDVKKGARPKRDRREVQWREMADRLAEVLRGISLNQAVSLNRVPELNAWATQAIDSYDKLVST